jgi:hypothetical protein
MSPNRALALAVVALAGTTALAADPCAEDVQQLCPDVKPGSSRVAACLRENEARLSPACGERLRALALRSRRIVEEFGRACRADVDQFCAGVEPGGGRMLGCLAQHQLELSPGCQSQLGRFSQARERVSTFKEACRADVETLCKDVPPRAGPLLECLQANQARLSSACNAADLRLAVEAASVVDTIEQMTSQDRVREALQILQGVDAVAFSRSQILFQLDSFEGLGNRASGGRLLFNPQFVFGGRGEFALQVKVPVSVIYPDAAGAPTQSGLGAVLTSFAWSFSGNRRVRQYVGLGLQLQTSSTPAVGGPWAVVPTYAVAVGLARWVSLTTQVLWFRSLTTGADYSKLDTLLLEPILVVNLPGRSFLALDTKLGWENVSDTFVPLMKGVAGIFVDRRKAVSISAWYQASLTSAAAERSFDSGVGFGLAHYFDW